MCNWWCSRASQQTPCFSFSINTCRRGSPSHGQTVILLLPRLSSQSARCSHYRSNLMKISHQNTRHSRDIGRERVKRKHKNQIVKKNRNLVIREKKDSDAKKQYFYLFKNLNYTMAVPFAATAALLLIPIQVYHSFWAAVEAFCWFCFLTCVDGRF